MSGQGATGIKWWLGVRPCALPCSPAALLTALLAAGAGLAIAVVVTGFHVPAWAASLGAGVGVVVWIQLQGATVTLPNGTYQPAKHALYWLPAVAGPPPAGRPFRGGEGGR